MGKIILFLVVILVGGAALAASKPVLEVNDKQAKALVLASLDKKQRDLVGLEVSASDSPLSPKFLFFTVTWKGEKDGSVIVGNYAVDPKTADVFSATMSCLEEENDELRTLQAKVRKSMKLTDSAYKTIKTNGPLCDE